VATIARALCAAICLAAAISGAQTSKPNVVVIWGDDIGQSNISAYSNYLTSKTDKSPRESFLYINDDQQVTALRYDNWKLVFLEQRAPGTLRVWAEPFTPLRVPKLFNLRTDPYYDWFMDHAFLLVPAQAYVGQFLATFKEYPQRQEAESFNLDDVMKRLQNSGAK
jgi:arylsulfatase A-like enzyme